MRAKMDRMDPIIRDFGRPDKRKPGALLSLRTSFNVAQMVVMAFRGPQRQEPRMLGVKQGGGGGGGGGSGNNSLKPSWSAVDLSDEGTWNILIRTYRTCTYVQ